MSILDEIARIGQQNQVVSSFAAGQEIAAKRRREALEKRLKVAEDVRQEERLRLARGRERRLREAAERKVKLDEEAAQREAAEEQREQQLHSLELEREAAADLLQMDDRLKDAGLGDEEREKLLTPLMREVGRKYGIKDDNPIMQGYSRDLMQTIVTSAEDLIEQISPEAKVDLQAKQALVTSREASAEASRASAEASRALAEQRRRDPRPREVDKPRKMDVEATEEFLKQDETFREMKKDDRERAAQWVANRAELVMDKHGIDHNQALEIAREEAREKYVKQGDPGKWYIPFDSRKPEFVFGQRQESSGWEVKKK